MKSNIHKFRAALIIALAHLLISSSLWAQSPEKMSYQAVIRNTSNQLVTGQSVGMQISILQGSAGGTAVYIERLFPTTNANGLVSLEIGTGTVVSGDFTTIDWSNGTYFIKTETDPTGGTTYTITGTSQLLSVPYALHAKTAETLSGGITETDPVFSSSIASGITGTDTTNWNSAFGWGSHASAGYLTSFTETDPLYTANFDLTSATTGDLLKFDGTKFVKFIPNYLTTEVDGSVTNEIELPTTGTAGDMAYWNGTAWVTVAVGTTNQRLTNLNGVPIWIDNDAKIDTTGQIWKDITSTTGEIWMDRNLGASQVATSSTDAASYGDLYQWGRGTDGHQIRTSDTIPTLSSSDNPGHNNFILAPSSPYDWRSPQNANLWQGVSGINNPCPSGYRLPTDTELEAERASWSSNDAAGAFASPLKLPVAGYRDNSIGSLSFVGSYGYYWSSTVYGTYSQYLYFYSSNADMDIYYRVSGFSVRCIKD
jgi:uncharacterized protein (TIGR02145 family)